MRRAHMSFGMQELRFTASSYTRHFFVTVYIVQSENRYNVIIPNACIHLGIGDSSSEEKDRSMFAKFANQGVFLG